MKKYARHNLWVSQYVYSVLKESQISVNIKSTQLHTLVTFFLNQKLRSFSTCDCYYQSLASWIYDWPLGSVSIQFWDFKSYIVWQLVREAI